MLEKLKKELETLQVSEWDACYLYRIDNNFCLRLYSSNYNGYAESFLENDSLSVYIYYGENADNILVLDSFNSNLGKRFNKNILPNFRQGCKMSTNEICEFILYFKRILKLSSFL